MNQPHLIVSGLERQGKTSFIQAWLKYHPEYVGMRAGPTQTWQDARYQFDHYFRDLHAVTVPKIWDRGHLCEYVYASIYRPQVWDGREHYLFTSEHGREGLRPVYHVYFMPTYMEFCQTDYDQKEPDLDGEIARYMDALDKTTWPVIYFEARTKYGWKSPERMVGEMEGKLIVLGHIGLDD